MVLLLCVFSKAGAESELQTVTLSTFNGTNCEVPNGEFSGPEGQCERVAEGLVGAGQMLTITCSEEGPMSKLYFNQQACVGEFSPIQHVDGQCYKLNENGSYSLSCTPPAPGDCFAGSSLVKLEDGSVKSVSAVVEGDVVQSVDARGKSTFSEVFLVQHRNDYRHQALRKISYRSVLSETTGSITLSDFHLIRESRDSDTYIAAKNIAVGSSITVVLSGDKEASGAYVTGVDESWDTVRNLHTMNDQIVVDGVLASSFTEVVPYSISRIGVIPLKLLYRMGLTSVVRRIDSGIHQLHRSYLLTQLR